MTGEMKEVMKPTQGVVLQLEVNGSHGLVIQFEAFAVFQSNRVLPAWTPTRQKFQTFSDLGTKNEVKSSQVKSNRFIFRGFALAVASSDIGWAPIL